MNTGDSEPTTHTKHSRDELDSSSPMDSMNRDMADSEIRDWAKIVSSFAKSPRYVALNVHSPETTIADPLPIHNWGSYDAAKLRHQGPVAGELTGHHRHLNTERNQAKVLAGKTSPTALVGS